MAEVLAALDESRFCVVRSRAGRRAERLGRFPRPGPVYDANSIEGRRRQWLFASRQDALSFPSSSMKISNLAFFSLALRCSDFFMNSPTTARAFCLSCCSMNPVIWLRK